MKGFGKLLAVGLCAALLTFSAGCSFLNTQQEGSSSTVSESAVENTPTPTPTPTTTPTPSPSPSPTPEVSPDPSVTPAGDFEEIFENNPIDRQLEDDLAYASSNASIQEAYDNAARRWEQLIENAVAAGEENFTGDQLTTFQEEQTAWEDGLDAAVEEIRADNTDDPMAAAQQVVEYYRTRAKDLCQQVYQATAKMPEFPSVDTEPLG